MGGREAVYFGHELGVQAREREEPKGRRRENAITEKRGEPADMATRAALLDETQVQSRRYSAAEESTERLRDFVRNSRNTKINAGEETAGKKK